MKYQVALSDGTIVAKTPEEGIGFYVKDGNVDQLEFCGSCLGISFFS